MQKFFIPDNAYAIVMAGGRGERFWPQSRLSHPKQLLRLLGNLTLIEQTVERLHTLFDYEKIFIITTDDYVAPMRSMMPNLPPSNIVNEPMGKDTAPCIAFAAAYIRSIVKTGDPVFCVVPSDHVINDSGAFAEEIADCLAYADSHKEIVTIGIAPAFPSTGYGYIQTGDPIPFAGKAVFSRALKFKEKPNLSTAEEYLSSGKYKWNSGMFLFRLSVLLEEFQTYSPELYTFYEETGKVFSGASKEPLEKLYEAVPRISIDCGVMEKSQKIAVAICSFDWDDIGSWTSMRNQIRPEENNNVVHGLHLGLDTKDCVIVGNSKHLIATVDVQDLIIVHTEDATLICNAKSAQRIKELVQLIASKPELETFL